MEPLSKDQIEQVSRELQLEGITFDPLREELLDHVICDIELQMDKGRNFDEAWMAVKNEIPRNHFKHIQTETMELLHKKFNVTQVFGIISLALLSFATLFKMLHLPGAGYLLIAFLMLASLTLITGSVRNTRVYREFKVRSIILLATTIIILFIAGLCFKLLHLPGASEALNVSIISLCILLPSLSIHFYSSKRKLKDHLLIQLIKDNQNTLEKSALILIAFGLLFNYSSLLSGNENFSGLIFFIFSMIFTGIYVFSLTWNHFVECEGSGRRYNRLLLVCSSLALIMFMLPVVGGFSITLRHIFAYTPGAILCLIVAFHYLTISQSRYRWLLAALSGFLMFYPLLRLGTKLGWLEGTTGEVTTNAAFIIGFLIFLIILLIVYRKERLFRAMIILTIGSHMIPNI